MLIYEMKLQRTSNQYEALDNAICTGRFIRNSVVRAWMDSEVKSRNDAYKYCKILSDNPEFPWARQLNSMANRRFTGKKSGAKSSSSEIN
jgi:putative transposase